MLKKKILGIFVAGSEEFLTISDLCFLTNATEQKVRRIVNILIKEGKIEWSTELRSSSLR